MRLSQRDRGTLAALAETLLPEGGPLPSAVDVGAADAAADAIRRLPPGQGSRVVWVVRALSVLPLTLGHTRRFRNLPAGRRARVAETLSARHGFRALPFAALRQLLVTTWASHPAVSAALGEDGVCLADSEDGRRIVAPLLPPSRPATPR